MFLICHIRSCGCSCRSTAACPGSGPIRSVSRRCMETRALSTNRRERDSMSNNTALLQSLREHNPTLSPNSRQRSWPRGSILSRTMSKTRSLTQACRDQLAYLITPALEGGGKASSMSLDLNCCFRLPSLVQKIGLCVLEKRGILDSLLLLIYSRQSAGSTLLNLTAHCW